MTREELTNSKEYKVSKTALDWFIDNQDADALDGFEAGYEEAEKHLIDKACNWLKENVDGWIDMPYDQEAFIKEFKKAMED